MMIKVNTTHGFFYAEYIKDTEVWEISTPPQYEEEITGDFVTELGLPATATEDELADAIEEYLDEEEAKPE